MDPIVKAQNYVAFLKFYNELVQEFLEKENRNIMAHSIPLYDGTFRLICRNRVHDLDKIPIEQL